MSNASLYLVQSDFAATPAALAKLQQLYQASDCVVLMGEALLHVQHTVLQQINSVYVLETDVEILAGQQTQNMQLISYAQFAELCLNYTRCIRLN
ncbi:MAG: DsrH/TusB family sulfur metabolism protein [Acinetobacter harbinensis]|uniref:DsrH/TusB family sulfur metabolism protein n=1 Tax=Acinetobacter harbinensis TaxID=1353941 RepID=UPI00057EF313|nr:DsrH/TusB family sulfur metabolism protein [Acinetobacter harbinensis]KWQ05100.1 sulfur relay protein TusB [Acinetobacter harbinensis]MDD2940145.1 DsrH/TusB family sulfur metabolism protein [Acinetobacter harbinensis]